MSSKLQSYADACIEEENIPAVSIAIWNDGAVETAAAGILNLDTGVAATTDSIFQIGSITKVMTACLVMQLVEAGRVDLDMPVKSYVRDFLIADTGASKRITVRQLLNHTSGIAGDFFPSEEGMDGPLIARLIDRCAFLPLVHPPGTHFSYSNIAFSLAGRLAEVVYGTPWAVLMRERVFEPLGMTHAIVDPKEAIRFRAAMGHVTMNEEFSEWRTADQTYLTLGQAPCGSTPMMRAVDLVTFARAHLDGGLAQGGERWLSPDAVTAMQAAEVAHPDNGAVAKPHAGLGWGVTDLTDSGTRLIQHNGATIGNYASLQLIPERNVAFAVLVNAAKPTAFEKISNELLLRVAGVERKEPEPVLIELPPKELAAYAGRYESLDAVIKVEVGDAALTVCVAYKHDPIPPFKLTLQPIGDDAFAAYSDVHGRRPNVAFVDRTQRGASAYVFWAGRLTPRASEI